MGTLRFDGDVRWVPVSVAAKSLRVTRQRVYQLIRQGALVSVKANCSVLVSMRSVDARNALLEQEGRS